MGTVTLTTDEYADLLRLQGSERESEGARLSARRRRAGPKGSRKASAYSKRYGAAFKRLAKKNKKKNGGWKQGGFARTQKAAHRAARKK